MTKPYLYMNHYIDCRDWIADEFRSLQRRNPLFSLRSFARRLEITPSQLSDLLAHRKGLSPNKALQIADKLKLNQEEIAHFQLLALAKHSRCPTKRLKAKEKIAKIRETLPKNLPHEMDSLLFESISGWENYAILELLETKKKSLTASECSHLLNQPLLFCENALNNLLKMGMLKQDKTDGESINDTESNEAVYLKPDSVSVHLTSTLNIPSAALRENHRQIISKALNSIDETPLKNRDLSSLTFAFDPTRIEEVREHIATFRRKMSDIFENGERTQVYSLSIQFFPLSREVSK